MLACASVNAISSQPSTAGACNRHVVPPADWLVISSGLFVLGDLQQSWLGSARQGMGCWSRFLRGGFGGLTCCCCCWVPVQYFASHDDCVAALPELNALLPEGTPEFSGCVRSPCTTCTTRARAIGVVGVWVKGTGGGGGGGGCGGGGCSGGG